MQRDSSSWVLSFVFLDRNPKKKNFELKPATEIAAVTAEGPGTGITLIFFSLANFTKNSPGSEIKGVPASDIKRYNFSPFYIIKNFFTFFGFIKFDETKQVFF